MTETSQSKETGSEPAPSASSSEPAPSASPWNRVRKAVLEGLQSPQTALRNRLLDRVQAWRRNPDAAAKSSQCGRQSQWGKVRELAEQETQFPLYLEAVLSVHVDGLQEEDVPSAWMQLHGLPPPMNWDALLDSAEARAVYEEAAPETPGSERRIRRRTVAEAPSVQREGPVLLVNPPIDGTRSEAAPAAPLHTAPPLPRTKSAELPGTAKPSANRYLSLPATHGRSSSRRGAPEIPPERPGSPPEVGFSVQLASRSASASAISDKDYKLRVSMMGTWKSIRALDMHDATSSDQTPPQGNSICATAGSYTTNTTSGRSGLVKTDSHLPSQYQSSYEKKPEFDNSARSTMSPKSDRSNYSNHTVLTIGDFGSGDIGEFDVDKVERENLDLLTIKKRFVGDNAANDGREGSQEVGDQGSHLELPSENSIMSIFSRINPFHRERKEDPNSLSTAGVTTATMCSVYTDSHAGSSNVHTSTPMGQSPTMSKWGSLRNLLMPLHSSDDGSGYQGDIDNVPPVPFRPLTDISYPQFPDGAGQYQWEDHDINKPIETVHEQTEPTTIYTTCSRQTEVLASRHTESSAEKETTRPPLDRLLSNVRRNVSSLAEVISDLASDGSGANPSTVEEKQVEAEDTSTKSVDFSKPSTDQAEELTVIAKEVRERKFSSPPAEPIVATITLESNSLPLSATSETSREGSESPMPGHSLPEAATVMPGRTLLETSVPMPGRTPKTEFTKVPVHSVQLGLALDSLDAAIEQLDSPEPIRIRDPSPEPTPREHRESEAAQLTLEVEQARREVEALDAAARPRPSPRTARQLEIMMSAEKRRRALEEMMGMRAVQTQPINALPALRHNHEGAVGRAERATAENRRRAARAASRAANTRLAERITEQRGGADIGSQRQHASAAALQALQAEADRRNRGANASALAGQVGRDAATNGAACTLDGELDRRRRAARQGRGRARDQGSFYTMEALLQNKLQAQEMTRAHGELLQAEGSTKSLGALQAEAERRRVGSEANGQLETEQRRTQAARAQVASEQERRQRAEEAVETAARAGAMREERQCETETVLRREQSRRLAVPVEEVRERLGGAVRAIAAIEQGHAERTERNLPDSRDAEVRAANCAEALETVEREQELQADGQDLELRSLASSARKCHAANGPAAIQQLEVERQARERREASPAREDVVTMVRESVELEYLDRVAQYHEFVGGLSAGSGARAGTYERLANDKVRKFWKARTKQREDIPGPDWVFIAKVHARKKRGLHQLLHKKLAESPCDYLVPSLATYDATNSRRQSQAQRKVSRVRSYLRRQQQKTIEPKHVWKAFNSPSRIFTSDEAWKQPENPIPQSPKRPRRASLGRRKLKIDTSAEVTRTRPHTMPHARKPKSCPMPRPATVSHAQQALGRPEISRDQMFGFEVHEVAGKRKSDAVSSAQRDLQECTFRPHISDRTRRINSKRDARSRSEADLFSRLYDEHAIRDYRYRVEQEKLQWHRTQDELRECTFQPNKGRDQPMPQSRTVVVDAERVSFDQHGLQPVADFDVFDGPKQVFIIRRPSRMDLQRGRIPSREERLALSARRGKVVLKQKTYIEDRLHEWAQNKEQRLRHSKSARLDQAIHTYRPQISTFESCRKRGSEPIHHRLYIDAMTRQENRRMMHKAVTIMRHKSDSPQVQALTFARNDMVTPEPTFDRGESPTELHRPAPQQEVLRKREPIPVVTRAELLVEEDPPSPGPHLVRQDAINTESPESPTGCAMEQRNVPAPLSLLSLDPKDNASLCGPISTELCREAARDMLEVSSDTRSVRSAMSPRPRPSRQEPRRHSLPTSPGGPKEWTGEARESYWITGGQ